MVTHSFQGNCDLSLALAFILGQTIACIVYLGLELTALTQAMCLKGISLSGHRGRSLCCIVFRQWHAAQGTE